MGNFTKLQATERDTTLNPRQLRKAGFIPATLYGKDVESRSIQVREYDFVMAYGKGLFEFTLAGLNPDVSAHVRKIQQNPVSREVLSIEFKVGTAPAGAKGTAKQTPAEIEAQTGKAAKDEPKAAAPEAANEAPVTKSAAEEPVLTSA